MKKYSSHNGFTLIELLLSVSIAALLITSVSVLFATMMEGRSRNHTLQEVEYQGSFILNSLGQKIRNAQSIAAPSIGSTDSSLTLTVSDVNKNPTLVFLQNNQLFLQQGSFAAVPLTNAQVIATDLEIQNLSRPDTSGLLQISFVLSYSSLGGRSEYSVTKTFHSSFSLRSAL